MRRRCIIKIDAHCHTDCSDGSLTIEERIAMIQKLGYEAATITDHDFISAEQVNRARKAAGNIPYIPAAEFSACYQKRTVHILGYFVDESSPILQEHIQKAQDTDRKISSQILNVLQKRGAQFGMDDLQSSSLHTYYSLQLVKIAAAQLFENDPPRTMQAFSEIQNDLGLVYADYAPWQVQDIIALIHAAHGIAVLAHPGGKNDTVMRKLDFYLHDQAAIQQYAAWGLDGIETRCPVHTPLETRFYEEMAVKYGLLTTSGSDCHGDDDYLGPALMGKFTDLFADGYERIFEPWQESLHVS
ncbi:MAG: PHP domain-containing protein [Anaerolineaceae bacterium]